MLPYRGKIPRGDRESDILFFLSFFSSLHPLQCGQANLNQFSGNPSLKLKRASIGAQWNVSGVPPIVVEEGDANQSLISLDGAKDIRSLRDDEDRELTRVDVSFTIFLLFFNSREKRIPRICSSTVSWNSKEFLFSN